MEMQNAKLSYKCSYKVTLSAVAAMRTNCCLPQLREKEKMIEQAVQSTAFMDYAQKV